VLDVRRTALAALWPLSRVVAAGADGGAGKGRLRCLLEAAALFALAVAVTLSAVARPADLMAAAGCGLFLVSRVTARWGGSADTADTLIDPACYVGF
jgi:hypothetical protein